MGLGNKPNEITFFVVPDTGITLPIKKVSSNLLQEVERALRREMPEPKPPMQKVDYGNGPELEENTANPDYLAALEAYKSKFNQELSLRTQKLLIRRGIIPHLHLTDEQKEQVAQLRQEMHDDFNVDLEGSDEWVYVTNIAMGTVEDLGDLINALIRRSTVTEEGISEALKKF